MFYLVVIVYSMLILILIYIFQFDVVPDYFKKNLHFNDEILASIGFEKFDNKDELVLHLLTPCTFLVINILQIHYFHEPWTNLTKRKLIANSLSAPTDAAAGGLSRKVSSAVATDVPSNEFKPSEADNDATTSKFTKTTTKKDEKRQKKEKFRAFAGRMFEKASLIYLNITIILWRLAELHTFKVIVATIGIVCLTEISLVNFVFFMSVLFSLAIDCFYTSNTNHVKRLFSGIFQIWISIMTISSMTYQLQVLKSPFVTNCSVDFFNDSTVDPYLLKPQDNLKYIGFVKANDIQENLKYYILLFVLLTFQKIVVEKMKNRRFENNEKIPIYSILFNDITWKEMDIDIIHFAKYAANYIFYRFGLEICFGVTAIVVCVRMDFYAIVYSIWLAVFLRMKRESIRRVWVVYFIFLIALLPIEYLSCLGLPPVLCYEYPWSKNNVPDPYNLLNKVRKWLFLSDYSDPPYSNRLIADFFQIFFVWLQYKVFELEKRSLAKRANQLRTATTATTVISFENDQNNDKTSPTLNNRNDDETELDIESIGGSNEELVYISEPYKNNPFRDFVSSRKQILDLIKYFIFMYSYWIVLAMVYLTGTSRISVLCMGYVILSFFFLWYGQTFLMKPLEKLLKLWNILVTYCFMVILTKAFLQIVLCLLTNTISEKTICILVDVFGIDCRSLSSPYRPDLKVNCAKSEKDSDDVSLFWDVFCFIVLLIQRRIYMSYMFEHVVNEYKAQSILAARGAGIFKEIIHEKVRNERKREIKVLQKLKNNVENIRKKQSNIMNYGPTDHYEKIRSGDYYMFESDDDDVLSDSDDEVLMNAKIQQKNKPPKTTTKHSKKDPSNSKTHSRQASNAVSIISDNNKNTTETTVTKRKVNKEEKDEHKKDKKDAHHKKDDVKIRKNSKDKDKKTDIETDERASWLKVEDEKVLEAKKTFEKYFFIATDFVINFLNRHSKDFRHVSHILAKEKEILKKDLDKLHIQEEVQVDDNDDPVVNVEGAIVPLEIVIQQRDNAVTILSASAEVDAIMNEQSRVRKFFSSVFYFMLSQSEMLCYLLIILNHLESASLLSAPLPIAVFLWAMLTIPRPTKTFWITTITYVEAVVVIKYLFQFKIFPWNDSSQTIYNVTYLSKLAIIGIDRKEDNFALFDLFVLLAIFIHRNILKVNYLN
jgi:piezo-type mechanosensitive ion channel component 1/2